MTIDVLLKDELTVDGVKEKKSCGKSLANENDVIEKCRNQGIPDFQMNWTE